MLNVCRQSGQNRPATYKDLNNHIFIRFTPCSSRKMPGLAIISLIEDDYSES